MALAAVIAVTLAMPAGTASAADWPQWRGPAMNGSTTETGLPATFSPTENVAWVAPMPGQSGATPIVSGDRVFVSSVDEKTQRLLALCLDLATGKVLWQRETGQNRRAMRNNMASPSPVTDGKAVTFYYGTAGLFAFDFSGTPLWSRDLEKDHGGNALMFGYSSAPLLYKDKLYIIAIRNHRAGQYGQAPEAEAPSYLLAIDPKTGKDLWKVTRPGEANGEAQEAYTTAIPYEVAGRSELLVYGADVLTGHDPATGRELWRWGGYNPRHINHWRVITSPVVAGDLAIVAGPKHSTLFAICPTGRGTLTESAVAWTFEKAVPDTSVPLLYQGRLYVLDDDRRVMTCLEPETGKPKWQLPLEGKSVYRASATGADGKIYLMSEVGEVVVLAAGDEPKILHRVAMGDAEFCRSSVVAAQGRLLIRTADKLYCVK
ncbi:MAG: PQQ-binding-like beta-propeller repeat protein [Planctomycetes bacterium]|nr:PQQ-binding-like beta-propeller repeat protein [Planctomycetota bacterium]